VVGGSLPGVGFDAVDTVEVDVPAEYGIAFGFCMLFDALLTEPVVVCGCVLPSVVFNCAFADPVNDTRFSACALFVNGGTSFVEDKLFA